MTEKWALISGSSKGLGKALALEFAERGFNIILHGRDLEGLKEVGKSLENKGSKFIVIAGDIKENETIGRLSACAEEKDIAVLINNAGIGWKDSLDNMSEELIDEIILTNLISPIKLTRRVLPVLKKKGSGTVININSLSGLKSQDLRSIYCASKWGLRGFSETLQIEAEKSNIRILSVYPSRIMTKPEFTYGMKPESAARKIFEAYEKNARELVLDERPEEYKK